MPTTHQLYNHTVNRFNTGLNAASDTYKLVLLSASASFNGAHTTLAQVDNSGAYQVDGNGWPTGGFTLQNVTAPVVDTNGSMFDADNISQLLSGGSVGPFSFYVIVNTTDSGSPPVVFGTLPSAMTVADGFPIVVTFNASGIVVWDVP